MAKWIIFTLCLLFSNFTFANNSITDFKLLGQRYFDLWVASQAPSATKQDIENYLSILTNDIGHQHLPYDATDLRAPEGKEQMRKGMMYYLGAHTKHSAVLSLITTGHDVIILKYDTVSEGINPQTKQVMRFSYETIEVLEVENEKISVIRKYSE